MYGCLHNKYIAELPAINGQRSKFFFLPYYIAVRCSTIALSLKGEGYMIVMAEKEFKEKVKIDDDEAKIERQSKDSFGNKVKEKHEIKQD